MKTVYFVRHAKSSWDDISLKDIERPLNDRGHRDAPFMAKLLKTQTPLPQEFISSPANRAFTTATYFAEEFGLSSTQIVVMERIYEAITQVMLDLINELDDEVDCVAIFGHNPTMTQLANIFNIEDFIPNIPTCAIFKVEGDVNAWEDFNTSTAKRVAFFYPKEYA